MALEGEIVADVPIQSDGEELFYMLLGNKVHHAPTLASHLVHDIKLHETTTGKHGSTKIWTFIADGKVEEVLDEVTHYDEKDLTIQLSCRQGDRLFAEYSESIVNFQFMKKDDGPNSVEIILKYKKNHPDVPEPQKYLDFFVSLIKSVDSNLLKI